MRVGIDCRMITHPGIGTYIKGLLDEFSKTSKNFVIFGDKSDLKTYAGFQIVEFKSPIYSLSEQLTGPSIFKNLDLLHVPHFNIPLNYKGKLVVTIHDIIYLFGNKFLPRNFYANFMIKNCLCRANKIIVVSRNTKNDLKKYFPDSETSKIEIIYEASRPVFCKINNQEILTQTKNKYNLPNKFILYVGSIREHKNLKTLINAYMRIKNRVDEALILVGRLDKREKQILNLIKKNNIIYVGEVPEKDLVSIYNLASLFVMPSLYEGFGLPILEAMSCGVPVVSSRAASLPEVVGDAGMLVNPKNSEAFSEAIYSILCNNQLRDNLIKLGFEQVKKFSWRTCAEKTLEVYNNALRN
ncbi:MAG: glycosyltransferase family 1 protein [Patescibacteria group bacterium]